MQNKASRVFISICSYHFEINRLYLRECPNKNIIENVDLKQDQMIESTNKWNE